MTEHTALPWTIEALPQGDEILKNGKTGFNDEALVILNAHHRLVEALRYAVDNPEFDSEVFDRICRTLLSELEEQDNG